jgi:radical SAM protein with 4Fe4S-binding SPASM domain
MIGTWSVKAWFRAYLNLGLISKILGHDRLHACTQGTDSVFIDPWGDAYACNVRNDLLMGNLREQSWEEIYKGEKAAKIRQQVATCTQNCWMVSSAKTAIRNKHFAQLPKVSVIRWVALNKLRSILHIPIAFSKYVDYNIVYHDANSSSRVSYLNNPEKKVLQPEKSRHYTQLKEYFNR